MTFKICMFCMLKFKQNIRLVTSDVYFIHIYVYIFSERLMNVYDKYFYKSLMIMEEVPTFFMIPML